MKRIILYILILILLWYAPVKGQSIAELEPIQAIWIGKEEGQILMKTDTEDQGKGRNVSEALENMKKESTGIIYPDTAQYLLVSEEAENVVPEMKKYLKGKVKVCLWEGGDLAKAAEYVQAHKIGLLLKAWQPGVKLPNLPL